jgi:hypothetical protein
MPRATGNPRTRSRANARRRPGSASGTLGPLPHGRMPIATAVLSSRSISVEARGRLPYRSRKPCAVAAVDPRPYSTCAGARVARQLALASLRREMLWQSRGAGLWRGGRLRLSARWVASGGRVTTASGQVGVVHVVSTVAARRRLAARCPGGAVAGARLIAGVAGREGTELWRGDCADCQPSLGLEGIPPRQTADDGGRR